jgi:hypothetical protein
VFWKEKLTAFLDINMKKMFLTFAANKIGQFLKGFECKMDRKWDGK